MDSEFSSERIREKPRLFSLIANWVTLVPRLLPGNELFRRLLPPRLQP